MKSKLINNLKKHLSSISKEDFISQWKEIKDLGFNGPTVEEFFGNTKEYFEIKMLIKDIHNLVGIEEEMNIEHDILPLLRTIRNRLSEISLFLVTTSTEDSYETCRGSYIVSSKDQNEALSFFDNSRKGYARFLFDKVIEVKKLHIKYKDVLEIQKCIVE